MAKFSTLSTEYNISVAIFFWLGIPESTLIEILKAANFTEIRRPPRTVEIAPGVKIGVGPPVVQLASFQSAVAEYNPEKFMLNLRGAITDVIEAFKTLPEAFKRHGYSVNSLVRYYEVTFPSQPLDVKNAVNALRKNIKLTKPLKLFNENLNIFSLSLSNVESPIGAENFNKWFHIRIDPDVQNTNKRVYIHIIKREKEFKKCLTFLEQIEAILQNIKEFLGEISQ